MSNIRVSVLGDVTNFKSSMSDVERIAGATAEKVMGSFTHVGNFLKTTLGVTAVGIGIEQAVDSASKLISLQKVQSQLIKNQGVQKAYQLTGDAQQTRWYSQRLDDMATQLSLQNGINKASIVQAQTFILSNQDLVTMTGHMKDGMKTVLSDAANIAEITGGNITSTTRMLTRMLADPAKSMASMRRMGFQLSQDEQKRIKALEKSGGLLKAQDLTIQLIGKHTQGIAAAASSPVDLLKNEVQLIWQSLGIGLIPILETLASALIEPVKAIMPVLSFMATTIKEVADTLGNSLGSIFTGLVPLFQLMTNSIIPALLNIITPLIQLVNVIITPLAKVFAQLVGTGNNLGPLALVFQKIGQSINSAFMKAVDQIAQSFEAMSRNGKLKELFDGLLKAFQTMAPILPQLATSVAQLLTALMPLIVATLPDMVYLIQVFANLVRGITPVLTTILSGITSIMKNLGPFKGLIEALAAVWFTRKLFLTPLSLAQGMVGGLIGKVGKLATVMKGVGTFRALKGTGTVFERVQAVVQERGEMTGSPLLGKIATGMTKFQSIMGKAGSLVKDFGVKFISTIRLIGTTFVTVITETIIPALSSMFAFIMANPIILAITAIVIAVAALIYLLIKHWRGFLTAVKAVWNAIVDVVKFVWEVIVTIVKTYIKLLVLEFTIIKDIFLAIWNGILAVVKWVWGMITTLVKTYIKMWVLEFTIIKDIFVGVWQAIYGAFKWVMDKISAGFNWLVGIFTGLWHSITNLGKTIWNGLVNGFIDAVNSIIKIWNSATGWIPGLGSAVHITTLQHIGGKTPVKRHNGGMVPGLAGREVPAILQAGEAVLTANQMKNMGNRGGTSLNVHPNAVNIVIHGNADAATTAQIRSHVEAQFKELHRTLKSMGR